MKSAMLVFAALMMGTSAAFAQDRTPAPYVQVDWAALSTAEQWQQADAVVILRIGDWEPWGTGPGLNVLHVATVLRIVKAHPVGGPTGQTFRFVQSGSTDEPRYPKGDAFIAFLSWSVKYATFTRLAGPQSVYAIDDGMVVWKNDPAPTLALLGDTPAPPREIMTVGDFVERLRALPKPQARGNISGRVEDAMGAVLPGVGIVLNGADARYSTVTDASGVYGLGNLVAGRYTLTAQLAGFKTITRDDIVVGEGQNAAIDFWMSASRIVEIDWPVPAGGLAGLWNAADAVLRVRIARTTRPEGRAFVEHVARTLEAFKWPALSSQSASIVAFRQEQWAGEPTPYQVGEDVVLFLNMRRGFFYRASGWFGAFLIQGDHIHTVHREVVPACTRVDDFIAKLRALAKEQR